MTNTELWAAVVGALLPPLLALLQKSSWSPKVQGALFALASAAASAVTTAIDHSHWNWSQWGTTLAWIVGTALVTFTTFWRPTGVIDDARALGPIS